MSASSNSFASTVELTLRPSHRALRAIVVLHLVCLALLPFSMQSGAPMIILAAALGLSWLYVRRHPALGFSPQSITRLVWHVEGQWILHRGRAEPVEAELIPGSLVHDWMLLLRFRLKSGATVSRLLLGDETEAEALRRLRARLSVA